MPGSSALASQEPSCRAVRSCCCRPPERRLRPDGGAAAVCGRPAQHVETLIRPALERGDWCSAIAGGSTMPIRAGRGLDRLLIEQLETIATSGLQPDLPRLSLPLETNDVRDPAGRIEAEVKRFLGESPMVCCGRRSAQLVQWPVNRWSRSRSLEQVAGTIPGERGVRGSDWTAPGRQPPPQP